MMTCFEFRAALDELRLTQRTVAALCGVTPQQVWKWCKGHSPVPTYAQTILSLLKTDEPERIVAGDSVDWHVERRHVYTRDATFKDLAKRWHPDIAGRDTNAEMQLVLKFRNQQPTALVPITEPHGTRH